MKVWSGKSVAIDRVRNELCEPVRIPHPCLSITENLPPAMLPEMAGRRGDDGFLDRWLYIYPDRRRKLKSFERKPVSNEAVRRWADVARRLYDRPMDVQDGSPCPHVVYPTNPGKEAFDRLHDRHVDEVNADDFPDHLRSPRSKLEEYADRFWLILTLLRHAADPTADSSRLPLAGLREAEDAWRLVDYIKAHHRRVRAYLQGKGLGGAPEGVKLILRWLRNHSDVESFPESDLTRDFPLFRSDRAELEDSLHWLSQRNAIRRLETPPRQEKRGRKPAPVWDVHPSLVTSEKSEKPENRPSNGSGANHTEHFSGFSDFSDGSRVESGQAPGREVFEL
jgi:hypothetical protein